MIFLVGQGLGWADNNGIACVNAHRVQILHVTDGDGGIVCIPHDLVFNFLVALDGFLHQHLMHRRKRKGVFHDLPEFFLVVRKSSAGTAQGESRTKHNWITDFLCGFQSFFHRICNLRG